MKSSSRNGAKVVWLCLHTTEGIMRAVDLRAWTAWAGSSHAACDETGVLLAGSRDGFVDYSLAAWTLRNGNPISENIEQCGFAKWSRADWLSRPKLLDATARWLADRSKARGIPLRRLSYAEIRARNVPGVLMHDDYSKATGDGTHWDCGPGYPWDVVLDKARAYAAGQTPQEDDLDAPQAAQLQRTHDLLHILASSIGRQEERQLHFRQEALAEIAGLRAALAAMAENSDLTAAELEAAVERATAKALRENIVSVDVDVAPGARTS